LPTGTNVILSYMDRRSTREKYGIEGSAASDFAIACCCACNAAIQEHKEMVVRETGVDPSTGKQYRSPEGMQMGRVG
jgi:hypothetical protein